MKPRFVDRGRYWRLPREFRRDHERCCIVLHCPVCRLPWSGDGTEPCDCYARDPEAWRAAIDAHWNRLEQQDLL